MSIVSKCGYKYDEIKLFCFQINDIPDYLKDLMVEYLSSLHKLTLPQCSSLLSLGSRENILKADIYFQLIEISCENNEDNKTRLNNNNVAFSDNDINNSLIIPSQQKEIMQALYDAHLDIEFTVKHYDITTKTNDISKFFDDQTALIAERYQQYEADINAKNYFDDNKLNFNALVHLNGNMINVYCILRKLYIDDYMFGVNANGHLVHIEHQPIPIVNVLDEVEDPLLLNYVPPKLCNIRGANIDPESLDLFNEMVDKFVVEPLPYKDIVGHFYFAAFWTNVNFTIFSYGDIEPTMKEHQIDYLLDFQKQYRLQQTYDTINKLMSIEFNCKVVFSIILFGQTYQDNNFKVLISQILQKYRNIYQEYCQNMKEQRFARIHLHLLMKDCAVEEIKSNTCPCPCASSFTLTYDNYKLRVANKSFGPSTLYIEKINA